MSVEEFTQSLEQTGYSEITTRTMDSRPANEAHAHEFSARGLVSAGEFIITIDGEAHSYKAGDEFEVAAGRVHSEAVGPSGARITIGKKF